MSKILSLFNAKSLVVTAIAQQRFIVFSGLKNKFENLHFAHSQNDCKKIDK